MSLLALPLIQDVLRRQRHAYTVTVGLKASCVTLEVIAGSVHRRASPGSFFISGQAHRPVAFGFSFDSLFRSAAATILIARSRSTGVALAGLGRLWHKRGKSTDYTRRVRVRTPRKFRTPPGEGRL